MDRDPELASWLIAQRRTIERALARRPDAVSDPRSPEAEALRRFRSFAASSLLRGEVAPPALDGVRVDEARAARLLDAWCEAAAESAGSGGARVRTALAPLADRFRLGLRATAPARRQRGRPRAGRRAVIAAIDRVADAFLAVDTHSGRIADANPAAGALLGVARDALIGAEAFRFVPDGQHERWWVQLDATAEGADPRRFRATLRDVQGLPVDVEACATRYATRRHTLALIVARTVAAPPAA